MTWADCLATVSQRIEQSVGGTTRPVSAQVPRGMINKAPCQSAVFPNHYQDLSNGSANNVVHARTREYDRRAGKDTLGVVKKKIHACAAGMRRTRS